MSTPIAAACWRGHRLRVPWTKHAHIAGTSRWALRIATEQPRLAKGVVAIDSAGLGEEIGAGLTDLMRGQAGSDTARSLLELFYQDQRLVNERAVAEMAQMQLADGAWTAQQAVASAAFAGGRQLEAARLNPASVPIPVLLIWGERDRVIPAQHAIDAVATFPDASLAIVPNIGHVPQVENPARTATLISRFAKSIS